MYFLDFVATPQLDSTADMYVLTLFHCSYEQMLMCWNVQPENRPSFIDLKMKFEAMLLEARDYLPFTTLTATEYVNSRVWNTHIILMLHD